MNYVLAALAAAVLFFLMILAILGCSKFSLGGGMVRCAVGVTGIFASFVLGFLLMVATVQAIV